MLTCQTAQENNLKPCKNNPHTCIQKMCRLDFDKICVKTKNFKLNIILKLKFKNTFALISETVTDKKEKIKHD